jgi:carbon monoxide dehydrogenase subunit G
MRIRHTVSLRASADAAWPVASFDEVATALVGSPPIADHHDRMRFTGPLLAADGVAVAAECWLTDLGCDHDSRCAFVRLLAREQGGPGIASGVFEVNIVAAGDRSQLELIADIEVAGSGGTKEEVERVCTLALARAGARLAHILDTGTDFSTNGYSREAEEMKLTNEFVIAAGIEEAWGVLVDLPRVARCVPGAVIDPQSVDGAYRGEIKVKLGPIVMNYSGTARLVATDESRHEAKIQLDGRDRKGAGTVTAILTNRLVPEGGATRVLAETDMTLTGRAAQFGRGIVQDVAGGVLAEFVQELENELRRQDDGVASGTAAAPGAVPAVGASGDHRIEDVQALDLGRVAGVRVLKRPAIALGAIVAVAAAWYLARRRSG